MARTKAQRRSMAGFIGATGGIPTVPVNTVAPSITGTATVGSTLTAASGTWTGNAAPTFERQWKRGGVPIAGATAATYVLTSADLGATITVTVTGINSAGRVAATSAATATIT